MEPLVLAAVSRLVAQTLLHTSQQKTDEDEEVVVVAAVDGVELITQSAIAMLTLHFTQCTYVTLYYASLGLY